MFNWFLLRLGLRLHFQFLRVVSLMVIIKIFGCTLDVLKVLSRLYLVHIFSCQLKSWVVSVSPLVADGLHVLLGLIVASLSWLWSCFGRIKHLEDAHIKRILALLIFSIIFKSIIADAWFSDHRRLWSMMIVFITVDQRRFLAAQFLLWLFLELSLVSLVFVHCAREDFTLSLFEWVVMSRFILRLYKVI